jgi:hypothetical protein
LSATRPPADWIVRYFIDPPDPNDKQTAQLMLAFGGGGAALGLVLLIPGGSIAGLGAILLIAGGIVAIKGFTKKQAYDAAYAKAMPRPSDADIDQLLAMDTFSIVNRSLPQLGLTYADLVAPRGLTGADGATFGRIADGAGAASPGSNQMVVYGPSFPCRIAIGEDGVKRYSRYAFMVICPTHYQLAIYRCELDLFSGGLQSEQTQEYHYQDVVAVRTDSLPLFRGGISMTPRPSQSSDIARVDTVREMQIIVSSGDRSRIVLGVSSAADATVDSGEPLDFQRVLARVRATLREKKGGTHQPDQDLI